MMLGNVNTSFYLHDGWWTILHDRIVSLEYFGKSSMSCHRVVRGHYLAMDGLKAKSGAERNGILGHLLCTVTQELGSKTSPTRRKGGT